MENKPRRRAPQAEPVIPEAQTTGTQAPPAPPVKRRRPAQDMQPGADGAQPTPPAPPQATKKPQQSVQKDAQQSAQKDAQKNTKKKKKPAKKKKKSKTGWLILIIVVLLGLIALLGVLVYQVNQKREFEQYVFDTEAIEGRIQTMTEAEILEELNRVIEEGMFNISIASSIVFDQETKQGQARIENIAANHYHMQVDIFLDSTQELVYSSSLIRPGYSVEHIRLSTELPPGEYEATAVFSAITQQEMQLFGQAAAQIKLYILDETGHIPTPTPAVQPTAAP